jgi:hypothetical protein
MVTISTFHNHFSRRPVNFIFIQFEQFIKINLNDNLNDKSVILTNEQLVSNSTLFQIFKLSLLCTEDNTRIQISTINGFIIYGIYSRWYWKYSNFINYYRFTELYNTNTRNPLHAQEPKRASSNKKIRKFIKFVNVCINLRIKGSDVLIREYYDYELNILVNYFNRYIEHNQNNRQIKMLTQIKKNYGIDIYNLIRIYLYKF